MMRRNFHSAFLGSASRRAAAIGAVMLATVITNGGEQWACDRMSGVSALDGHFIGWGTGAGTAAKADTTLFTEAAEARAVATITTNGTNAAQRSTRPSARSRARVPRRSRTPETSLRLARARSDRQG
jgi:hypothetical protein